MTEGNPEIPCKVFKQAFDHSPVGTAIVGADNEWLYVNEACAAAFGYGLLEWPHDRTWRDFTVDKDIDGDQQSVDACLQRNGLNRYTLDKRYHRKNEGEWFWAKLSVHVVRDEDGNFQYFVSYIEPKPRPPLSTAVLAVALKHWKPVSSVSAASFFIILWVLELITTEKLKKILEILMLWPTNG